MRAVNSPKHSRTSLGDATDGVCPMPDRVASQSNQWTLTAGGSGGGHLCLVEP